jgi:hypothetical protein
MSITQSSLWDLFDVTLACEESRNLSLPCQLLSVLTAMFLPFWNKTKAVLLMLFFYRTHVLAVTWIFQSCSMYFSPSAEELNHAEV